MGTIRNLIAHNPLFLSLFDDRVGVDLEYQISKFGQTDARITIEQLENHCREVEQLADQLQEVRDRIDSSLSQKGAHQE